MKIIKKIVFFSLMVALLLKKDVLAEDTYENNTAGQSLEKEHVLADDEMNLYSRAIQGWVKTADGRWWYQYSNGTWPASTWRKINGNWYYFDSDGYWVDNNKHENGTLKGVDVSSWQEDIDWQAVKNDGIQFAFVRVGHGSGHLDKYFHYNMQEANRVGIPAGVYFYSLAQNEAQAIADAQFVIKQMEGHLISYPVVIDLEDESQEHLSKEKIGKIAKAYCDEIRKAGYTPMLYCNEWWYQNHIDMSYLEDVEKWVARYNVTHSETIPRGIWQCCSTGKVNGIKWNADINFGYIDYTKIVTPRKEAQPGYQMSGFWKKNNVGWWYSYYMGGYPVSQWMYINDVWYWFDAEGYMVTGWEYIKGQWYYFDQSGAMMTGWLKLGNKWYYLNDSGEMHIGWINLNGKWYYMAASGEMITGWIKSGNVWYYCDRESGSLYEEEWLNNLYYFHNEGAMATGWVLINGNYYYFAESGEKVTNKWIGDYYLKSDGVMAKNEWIGNYYVDQNGKWVP